MAITVITNNDLGTGLKVENQKVVVDVAALAIPVDVKLAGVDVDVAAKKMKFTLSDGSEIERDVSDFLVADTDTKLTSGTYASNKITLTDSAGGNVEVDLATLVQEINASIDAAKEEAKQAAATDASSKVDAAKQELQQALDAADAKITALENKPKPTGVELTSLGGTSLGYLVSAADVATA